MELAEGDAVGDGAVDLAADVLEDVHPHRLGDGEGAQVFGGVGVAPVEADVEALGAEVLDRLDGREVQDLRLGHVNSEAGGAAERRGEAHAAEGLDDG